MENIQKCSSIEHKEIDAIFCCNECRVYMCNKCENFHSKLFKSHHTFKIDKEEKEIFNFFCKEKNHLDKLDYFCKTHNQLCCAACLSKIKSKGNGQHNNCNICEIEDIIDEKKNKLEENIKILENLSNKVEPLNKELKDIFQKISEIKENLKLEIQNTFTKIRNALNDREDQLLLELENKFDNFFFKEKVIKNCEKLPNKIKLSLEDVKNFNIESNDENKLISFINHCISIENNIKEINEINSNINKCKSLINLKVKFLIEENNKINLIENIKSYGKISLSINKYQFKKCPINIREKRKYSVRGEKQNILTKIGEDGFVCGLCENPLEDKKIYKWKIKILKTKNNYNSINVGVAPIDLDINSSEPYKLGWFIHLYDASLYSGPPYNYKCKATNFKHQKDEIIVIMDMNNKNLKFIIDNEDKGESYINIPTDKPIVPAVTLYYLNDSLEIIEL